MRSTRRALAFVSFATACLVSACAAPAGSAPLSSALPEAVEASPTATSAPEFAIAIASAEQYKTPTALFLYVDLSWSAVNAIGDVTHTIDWGDRSTSAHRGNPYGNGRWILGHEYKAKGTYQITIMSTDGAGRRARASTEAVILTGYERESYRRGDSCEVAGTSTNTVFRSMAGSCRAESPPGPGGRMEVTAAIAGGISEHPIVRGRVWNAIRLGAGAYTLRANIGWKGFLGGVGVGGTSARSLITINIVDGDGRDIVTPLVVDEVSVRESAVTVAGLTVETPPDGKAVVFEFTVPASHSGAWRIELRVLCEAQSGVAGTNVWCSYDDAEPGRGGYVAYIPDRSGYILLLDKTLE